MAVPGSTQARTSAEYAARCMSRDADEKRPEAVTKAAGLACALLGDGTCESIHANIFRVGSEYQGSDMH